MKVLASGSPVLIVNAKGNMRRDSLTVNTVLETVSKWIFQKILGFIIEPMKDLFYYGFNQCTNGGVRWYGRLPETGPGSRSRLVMVMVIMVPGMDDTTKSRIFIVAMMPYDRSGNSTNNAGFLKV